MKITAISPEDVTGSMSDPKCGTCGKTELAEEEKWCVGIVLVHEGTNETVNERHWLCPTCAHKAKSGVNIMIET